MDKPKIHLFPSGLEIQSGFLVEFDEDYNVKINGEESSPYVLLQIADNMLAELSHREMERKREEKKNNRIYWNKYWYQLDFHPKFTDTFRKQGVYVIDNVYVGKSVHIKDRIKTHIQQAINDEHINKDLGKYIKERLFNGKTLTVQWFLGDATRENEAIVMKMMLDKGYSLLNQDMRNLSLLTNKTSI